MKKIVKILILSGANLNLLGKREIDIYGTTTIEQIHRNLYTQAHDLGVQIQCLQSNKEYELIECLHAHFDNPIDGVVINPAGWTHTSVVLLDALMCIPVPFIEVHLSNIYAREPFRAHSYFSPKAHAVISGLGAYGYSVALDAMARLVKP